MTILYRSHLTIFSIDNQYEKGSKKNAMVWSTNAYFPGGPHTILIQGENTINLEDILIGEVWLCGGQSNMEWSGDQGLQQSKIEAPNATNNSNGY